MLLSKPAFPRCLSQSITPTITRLKSANLLRRSRENDIPSSSFDTHNLSELLNDGQKELDLLEKEMLQFPQITEDLEAKRDELSREMALARSLLSPIRRLPLELLIETFTHYTTQYFGRPDCVGIRCIHLTFVCHYWRTIILMTSSFWSSIKLSYHRPNDLETRDNVILALQSALARSGNHVLNIDISPTSRSKIFHGSFPVDRQIALLGPHCARWERLHLDPLCAYVCDILSSIKGHLPNLRFLSLCWLNPSEVNDVFQIAPKLNTVCLHCPDLLPFNTLHLPWSQIEHLDVKFLDSMQIIAILSHCPSLITLFWAESGSLGRPSELEAHMISNLRSLGVALSSGEQGLESLLHIFRVYALPRLSSLKLYASPYIVNLLDEPVGELQRLITSRSQSSLSTLLISNLCISPKVLVELLDSLSSLRSLTIYDQQRYSPSHEHIPYPLITDILMSHMNIHLDSKRPILPHLQRLHLMVRARPEQLTDLIFIDMVKSRRSLDLTAQHHSELSRLQFLVLKLADRPFTPSLIGEIEALKRGGLNIRGVDSEGDVEMRFDM